MVLNKKSKTTQIQSLDVDGKHVTDNNAVAQTMNDFFCDIGKSLSDKIPQKANPLIEDKLEVNPENLQFKLQAFDVPQIKKVFGKFKTSKGFGPDGVANHFLKSHSLSLQNLSVTFSTSQLPLEFFLKIGKLQGLPQSLKVEKKTIVPIIDRFLCSHFWQDSLRN